MRRHAWTVQEIDSYESCRALTLTRVADHGELRSIRVLHPFDDVDAVVRRSRPIRVGMRAWRHACRALIAEDVPASGLRTAAAAHLDLLPYQLEPALALLRGDGSRLLVADDVGLGKTVQAMLALSELRARGVVRRALVVCPAGLREQWADECVDRFGMRAAIFDRAGIRRVRASIATTENPWTTEPLVIVSSDYVKRPEILGAALGASWDVVVVDEAHGCSGPSDRHSAVQRIAKRAMYVILLTATPHNGDDDAFADLCGIGCLDADPLLVFRRTRTEVGRDAGRRAHTLRVRASEPERRMHAALERLTAAVRREAAEAHGDAWLLLSLLHKRALSGAYALAASAERRLHALREHSDPAGEQLPLPLDDGDGELDASDVPPMWSAPILHDRKRERCLFVDLLDAARAALGRESKIRRLVRIVDAVQEPVIVFTEYRDTLLHLRDALDRETAMIHGGMSREQRREALVRFRDVGLLLATDAAGEGLNLQGHCRMVVNLELPWNPMRLEQRIGRVDRIGQRRRVHVVHLIGADTREAQLLERLTARVSQAQARIGATSPLSGRSDWSEEQSARVVLLGEPEAMAPSAVMSTSAVPLTRLAAEGAHEAVRIALQRAVLKGGAPRDRAIRRAQRVDGAPLQAVARRRRLRSTLRGRSLALFRTRIVDGTGRAVATRVDAVATCAPLADPAIVDVAAGTLAHEPQLLQWQRDAAETHARFADVRARRAASVVAHVDRAQEERQPGLFDRRAEREWQVDTARRTDALLHARERLTQAGTSRRTHSTGPELALLLVSR